MKIHEIYKAHAESLPRIFTRLFLADFYFELDVEHISQSVFGYVDHDKMVCYVEIVICK